MCIQKIFKEKCKPQKLTYKSFPTTIKTLLALLFRKLFLLFCKCLTLGKLRDVVLTGSGDETGGRRGRPGLACATPSGSLPNTY